MGSSTDLKDRIYLHRNRLIPGFTKKHNVTKLVYFEELHSIEAAIAREKQIKDGSRAKKIKLIHAKKPDWQDLFDSIKKFTNI